MNIHRLCPEWLLALLSIAAGASIGLTGDARLGAYILWQPRMSLLILTLAWCYALFALGSSSGLLLWRCHRRCAASEGVCAACPMAGHCVAQRWRPRLNLAGAILWGTLAISLESGDAFLLAAVMAAIVAAVHFLVFSALSPHVSWIRSFR